jgi:hypothetical protein
MLPLLAAVVLWASTGQPAQAQEEPTIAKDFLQVNAWTNNVYRGNYDIWSWVPMAKFRVNGPIASGSQLYMQFTIPGRGAWVEFDCPTEEIKKGYWWKTECGGRDIPEAKGVTYTGTVNFTIRLRNELTGTNSTLYTGKAKVAKVHSGETGPRYVNHFDYYVEHDWKLPIGYVYLAPGNGVPDYFPPRLFAALWYRGDPGLVQAHLFHQGKEVAKDSCGGYEEIQTTHLTNVKWRETVCEFRFVYTVRLAEHMSADAPIHELNQNPGDYEIKVLQKGRLARSAKFTVAEDGSFDNGIASANKLGSDRVIIPVQVIGTQDGAWNKLAWKTEAFYGNPLTGFTPPQ